MKWFEEEPPFNSIAPIQTIVAAPDTIYYGFMTGTGSPNQLALACFDADLNLRWTRYFLEPDMFHWAPPAILARCAAQANRALRPARPPRALAKPRLGKLEHAGPHLRAVSHEGDAGRREELYG